MSAQKRKAKRNKRMNEIIVGNIGSVYCGSNDTEALRVYQEYIDQSKIEYGRAAGETVTWFLNHEIKQEYIGRIEREGSNE